MLRVPPAFPLSFLIGLLSLAPLGGGGYALWGWHTGALAGAAYLWCGVAAVAWSLAGRWAEAVCAGWGSRASLSPALTQEGCLAETRRRRDELPWQRW